MPYPAREVLAAFATACSGAEDAAVNLVSATAAGWERLPADADTPVSRLVHAGQVAMDERARAEGNAVPEAISGVEFRRTVAGRVLFLSVSGIRADGYVARGCRLFDFAAPRAISSDELYDWSARDASRSSGEPGGFRRVVYSPGLKPGHMEMEVYYIPPGTKLPMGIEFSGISLVATATERQPAP